MSDSNAKQLPGKDIVIKLEAQPCQATAQLMFSHNADAVYACAAH